MKAHSQKMSEMVYKFFRGLVADFWYGGNKKTRESKSPKVTEFYKNSTFSTSLYSETFQPSNSGSQASRPPNRTGPKARNLITTQLNLLADSLR